jgi:hypothetical protein
MSIAPPGLHNVTLPALAAGPRGYVGSTYYASSNSASQMMTAYITETHDALDTNPLFWTAALNDPAHPIFRDYGLSSIPRADFIGGTFDAHGAFWAGLVHQLNTPDANGNVATRGNVATLTFPTTGTPAGAGPGAGIPTGGFEPVTGVHGPARARCARGRRLTFTINRVPHARLIRVSVYVDEHLRLVRRGRNIRRVSIPRPMAVQFSATIITTTNTGKRVVTVRAFRRCARIRTRRTGRRHGRTAPRTQR